jgi:hypothetical protein
MRMKLGMNLAQRDIELESEAMHSCFRTADEEGFDFNRFDECILGAQETPGWCRTDARTASPMRQPQPHGSTPEFAFGGNNCVHHEVSSIGPDRDRDSLCGIGSRYQAGQRPGASSLSWAPGPS